MTHCFFTPILRCLMTLTAPLHRVAVPLSTLGVAVCDTDDSIWRTVATAAAGRRCVRPTTSCSRSGIATPLPRKETHQ